MSKKRSTVIARQVTYYEYACSLLDQLNRVFAKTRLPPYKDSHVAVLGQRGGQKRMEQFAVSPRKYTAEASWGVLGTGGGREWISPALDVPYIYDMIDLSLGEGELMNSEFVHSTETQTSSPTTVETCIALGGIEASLRRNVAPLPDIDEIEEFNGGDLAFLQDVVKLMRERGISPTRFTAQLGHQHFPIREDEVLLETIDREARTLTLTVVQRSELNPERSVPTTFRLDNLPESVEHVKALASCETACGKSAWDGRHYPVHRSGRQE